IELRLHDPRLHVERRVAEHGLRRRQVLVDHERDARVRLESVPVRVVVVTPALLRHLRGLGLQLLEAHDVGPVALEPLADLRGARTDPVHVPGSDLHCCRCFLEVAMPLAARPRALPCPATPYPSRWLACLPAPDE